MKIDKILIGVDPDVEKSGVASLAESNLELNNLSFFDLFDYFKKVKEKYENPIIYIECGFLNKSNWHSKAIGSAAINAKIGERTGANFEVAKKIVEMCDYLKLDYIKIKPTKSKITNDYFKKITGYNGKTNQEQRDAFMLILGR